MRTRKGQYIISIFKLGLSEKLLSAILLFMATLLIFASYDSYFYPSKLFIMGEEPPKFNINRRNNFSNNGANKSDNNRNIATYPKDTLDLGQNENGTSISFQDSVKKLKKQIAEKKGELAQFDYLKNEFNDKIRSLLEAIEEKNKVITILNEAKEQQIAELSDSLKSEKLEGNNLTYKENNTNKNKIGSIKIPKEIESIKFTQDFDKFLEKYTKDSLSQYDSTNIDDFSNFVEIKEQEQDSFSWKDIRINDIKFDIQDENILITLNLLYSCPKYFSEGKKSILMTRSSDNWKIIKEDYASIDNIEAEQALINFVKEWQKAWESQNIDEYIKFYSPDFQNINLDREKWYRDKKSKFENAEYIKVEPSNYKISSDQRYTWQVTFHQTYKSDIYSDEGNKRLIIKGDLKNLKIINEKWWP